MAAFEVIASNFGRGGFCSTSGSLSGSSKTILVPQLSPRGTPEGYSCPARLTPAVFTELHTSFGCSPYRTASQARRANISCQSSLTLTGALASYDIPEQEVNRGMPQWLSRCIAEAAKHLDEAPFLQLLVDLKNDRFQHHSVSHAVLQAPQLWQGIAEHLAQSSPEVLLLIHPINMTSSHSRRALSAAKKSAKYSPTGVLTGIAVEDAPVRSWQEKHAERMESCARMMQSGLSFPALSGRVGDCCDDEADTQVPLANNILPHSPRSSGPREQRSNSEKGVEYWGVVIQSHWSSQVDGCYVLKTVRSAVEDCTCVHYSLVNVCQGEPYSAQLAASWLT